MLMIESVGIFGDVTALARLITTLGELVGWVNNVNVAKVTRFSSPAAGVYGPWTPEDLQKFLLWEKTWQEATQLIGLINTPFPVTVTARKKEDVLYDINKLVLALNSYRAPTRPNLALALGGVVLALALVGGTFALVRRRKR